MPATRTIGVGDTISAVLTAALPSGIRFIVQPKSLPARRTTFIGVGHQLHSVPVVGRVVTATSGHQPLFAADYVHYAPAISRALPSGGKVQTPRTGGWVVWIPVGAPTPLGAWPRKPRKAVVHATPSDVAGVAPPPDTDEPVAGAPFENLKSEISNPKSPPGGSHDSPLHRLEERARS
jgi:hypothetical protein